MQLVIKNMVCNRCIVVVKQELEKLQLHARSIALGEVQLSTEPNATQLTQLREALLAQGFELLDDQRKILVGQIKQRIIDQVHHQPMDEHQNFSHLLAVQLNKDYSYLSNLFSSVECITIEKYIIHQKIEKVKELIIYNELNLSEIAYRLGYSSVAYLSAQFKKVTGFTPSYFKQHGNIPRKPIDQV